MMGALLFGIIGLASGFLSGVFITRAFISMRGDE